jgi:hypothetical protein
VPSEIITPKAEAAETPIVEANSMRTRADFERFIDDNASKYGVDPEYIKQIVSCETGNTWDPSIQSGYYRNGIREDSWGLAQLNKPLTKGITYEQAKDPTFALTYLMSHLHKDHWSCE